LAISVVPAPFEIPLLALEFAPDRVLEFNLEWVGLEGREVQGALPFRLVRRANAPGIGSKEILEVSV